MTALVKKHKNLHSYLIAEEKLTPKQKEKEFEDLVGLFLKTDDFYGSSVYSPNHDQIPASLIEKWNIGHLLSGATSKGADWFTECMEGTAVEVKYQHDDSSIKLDKLSVKEVALNKTNIKNRVLVTNLSRVSSAIEEYLDNWTYIFGEDIYNEEIYDRIRSYVLTPTKKEKLKPAGYREDLLLIPGNTDFHEQSIKDLFDEIVAQIGHDGVARVLSIKPTAAGKGTDPILLWKFFLEKFFNKESMLTVKVNPSLTVLSGNLIKEVKDINARGAKTRVIVLAGDVKKGIEDKDELNRVKKYSEVITRENLLIDIMLDWASKNYHLHIETTIHSYKLLGEIMIAENIVGDFMYIDEVKHTVQSEDSDWAKCVFNQYGAWTIRVGADANILEGADENGLQVPTSMRNSNLWRNLTKPSQFAPVEWQEGDVTARGWKRKTKLIVNVYDVNDLPVEIQGAVHDKKSAIVTINGVAAPQEWIFKLDALARYLLDYPKRKFPMFNLNSHERVKKFIQFTEHAWPEIVKQYGDSRNPEIRRLLAIPFIDIYSNGTSHNKIQRLVDGIPTNNPKGATVCQVKKLSEGWDPKDGWVDTISFVDNSGSKIRISQTIGRGQRLGGGFDELNVIETIIVDSTNQFEVKRAFTLINQVAEALELGDNIDDSITFFDHTNQSVPGGGRTKGSKYTRPVWELEGGLVNAFKGFLQHGNFNPHRSIVEEIYQDSLEFYNITYGNQFAMKEFHDSIANKEKYKEFFSQYSSPDRCRRAIAHIRLGRHFLLPTKLKIEARKKWKQFNKDRNNQYVTTDNLIIEFAETFDPTTIENNSILYCKEKQYLTLFNDLCSKYVNSNGGKISKRGLQAAYNKRGRYTDPKFNQAISKALKKLKSYADKFSDLVLKEFEKEIKKVPHINAISLYATALPIAEKYKLEVRKVSALNKKIKGLEITQQKNKDKLIELYQLNYRNFKNVVELDQFVIQQSRINGIITNKGYCANNLRRKQLKDISNYFKVISRQQTVKNRKKYLVGTAKSVTTPKGIFSSRKLAAEAHRVTPAVFERMMLREGHLYYYTNTGPKKPVASTTNKGRIIVTHIGKFSTQKEAAKAYKVDVTTFGSWMKKKPTEFYYE